jgi:hypothetical protein
MVSGCRDDTHHNVFHSFRLGINFVGTRLPGPLLGGGSFLRNCLFLIILDLRFI